MGALDTLLSVLSVTQEARAVAPGPPGIPYRKARIGTGDRGARQMLELMRAEARRSLTFPIVLETAVSIAPPEAPEAEKIRALRSWLELHFSYAPDPYRAELIRSPSYLLERIREKGEAFGDCDDCATFAAALGMAMGLPARFILYAFGASLPFSHVFTELFASPGGWLELDITRPSQMPPGVEVTRVEIHEV